MHDVKSNVSFPPGDPSCVPPGKTLSSLMSSLADLSAPSSQGPHTWLLTVRGSISIILDGSRRQILFYFIQYVTVLSWFLTQDQPEFQPVNMMVTVQITTNCK